MRVGYKIILLLLLLQLGFLKTMEAQNPAPRPAPKLVAIGEIAKINLAKRSLELKSRQDTAAEADPLSGELNVGITIGRSARTIEDPRGPRDPADPRDLHEDPFPPDRTSRIGIIRTSVFLTDDTICKERDKTILCTDLKVTDSLRVTGDEKRETRGKGLYATEIVRTPLRQPQPLR